MWDGTMTGSQRLFISAMRYGDDLFDQQAFCAAYEQYQIASGLGTLDNRSQNHFAEAGTQCYPPTEIPPTLESTPVTDITPTP